MSTPVLEIQNATFTYPGDDTPILQNMNLKIYPGERLSIVGPGGSGKSTLLKVILGLLAPQSGSVELLETDMVHGLESQKLKMLSRVGMAFQQGALFDFMTVKENLEFSMIQAKVSKEAIEQRIDCLLYTSPSPRDLSTSRMPSSA